MPKEIKDLDVHFISLVKSPANQKPMILKSDGSVSLVIPIQKTDPEKQIAYGIVYAPDEIDSQGDFMTAEEVQKAAYNFMKAQRTGNIDAEHDFEKRDEVWVAESWIVRKGDALFADEEGAWAVGIKIDNTDEWEKVKKGDYTGISLAGQGKRKDGLAKTMGEIKSVVKSLLQTFEKDEPKFTKSDYTDLRTYFNQMDRLLDDLKYWTDLIAKFNPDLMIQINGLKDKIESDLNGLAMRVATLEKATPGSPQQEVGELTPEDEKEHVAKSILAF
ncbi:MAG: hypothetical protein D6712_17810 [Chloroflexi bacterium]|nr:MAG: hypothetical protein D6712_17810 [Chloroflexota bacterium]